MDGMMGSVPHAIASREAWLVAREALLAEEKAHTREGDRIAEARRALPWVRVEKDYAFETETGPRRLADLFEGRSQLLVYHFMFGPDDAEGCASCSYLADHIDGARKHLGARDVTLIAAARAPLAKLSAYRARMGWAFPLVSSAGSAFNADFGVSFAKEDVAAGSVVYNYRRTAFPVEDAHGASTFALSHGDVYHTFSAYGRGVETVVGAYAWLDLAPKGRDEADLPWPMAWVRRHDAYDAAPAGCCAG